ncbi:hypothetical protein D3C76_1384930 [compost metagenome]
MVKPETVTRNVISELSRWTGSLMAPVRLDPIDANSATPAITATSSAGKTENTETMAAPISPNPT